MALISTLSSVVVSLLVAAMAEVVDLVEDTRIHVQVSLLQQQAAKAWPHAHPFRHMRRKRGATKPQPAKQVDFWRSLLTTVINLDLPPFLRWQGFYRANRELILHRLFLLQNKTVRADSKHVQERDAFIADVSFEGHQEYIMEMRGIVEALDHPDVTVNTVLDFEMAYERGQTMGCTSVLAATVNGTVIHGQKLDLPQGKGFTGDIMEVTFTRNNKPVMVSTNSLLMVGISTGYRARGYSVARNARKDFGNTKAHRVTARKGGRANSLVLRDLLQHTPDFETAVHELSAVDLVVPQYFSLAGAGAWEAALIAHDCIGAGTSHSNVQVLSPKIGRWFFVQNDADISEESNDQQQPAAAFKLEHMRQEDVSERTILEILATPPLLYKDTMFTWIAVPAIDRSRVQLGEDGLKPVMSPPDFHLRYSGARIDSLM